MEIIVFLMGASLLVALIFLIAFLWSLKSGQYDDSYTPSVRMLFDPQNKASNNQVSISETQTKP